MQGPCWSSLPSRRGLNQQELVVPGSPAAAAAAAQQGNALALTFLTCRWWHLAAVQGRGHCLLAQLFWATGSSTSQLLTGPGLLAGSKGCTWSLAGMIPMAACADLTMSPLSAQ